MQFKNRMKPRQLGLKALLEGGSVHGHVSPETCLHSFPIPEEMMEAEGKREREGVAREGEEAEGRKEAASRGVHSREDEGGGAEGGGREGEIQMRKRTLSREKGEDGRKMATKQNTIEAVCHCLITSHPLHSPNKNKSFLPNIPLLDLTMILGGEQAHKHTALWGTPGPGLPPSQLHSSPPPASQHSSTSQQEKSTLSSGRQWNAMQDPLRTLLHPA